MTNRRESFQLIAAIALLPTLPTFLPAEGEPAQLDFPLRITNVVHAYASFNPANSNVIYQSNANGNWDLYALDLSNGKVAQLTNDPAADITPVCSPDGARITFVSERHGNRDVFLCDSDGGKVVRLTTDEGHDLHPVFNADGSRIMFGSNRGNASPDDYDIYVMKSDGSDQQRLTSGPEVDTYSSWSPDGTLIVTRRVLPGGNNEVFVLDADGGNPRNLTNDSEAYDGWPVWTPDGKWIFFASGKPGGNHHLFRIRPDGSERTQVSFPEPGREFCYDTQPTVSADGRLLACTRYRQGIAESADIHLFRMKDILPAP